MKKAAGQMTRLESFIHTLQEQDDTMFLMRRVVKWMCLCVSAFSCSIIMYGNQINQMLQLSTVAVGMNILSMGVLSMVFALDFPVIIGRGVTLNLYGCLKYFPVGRLEIYSFLRKRLLRFLSLYGLLEVLIWLILGAMEGNLSLGSLIFSLVVWLLLALVGFSMIRVHLVWRYRKKIRSL